MILWYRTFCSMPSPEWGIIELWDITELPGHFSMRNMESSWKNQHFYLGREIPILSIDRKIYETQSDCNLHINDDLGQKYIVFPWIMSSLEYYPPFFPKYSHNQYTKLENLQIVSPSEDVKIINVLGHYLRKYSI